MILAGDIGGTNTRLGLFELEQDRPKPITIEIFPSGQYSSLEQIIQEFLGQHPQSVTDACVGIAGPIKGHICETPNLPWKIDSRNLAQLLGLPKVELLNDLEANAHGISVLSKSDLVMLHPGRPDENGNAGLISAGTGLGEAGLHWVDEYYKPFASEGGHVDFAPRNQLEIDLLSYLLKTFGHVSYERVLSGPGLHNIYKFLVETGRGQEPDWLRDELQKKNPGAVISKVAMERRAPVCEQAHDIFVSIYGAEAGNLALKVLATGGIFLGGGIAPKILPKLQEPGFLEAFWSKGRMTDLLKAVPVHVIVNDKTALLGAARVAFFGA
ncbi:MAG: glucokinase [Verrucomicrobia bacterium]|nr:glucokinase [Verrucomicrobiota bacterium]